MGEQVHVHEFEWDPAKAKANSRKHGVTFEEGASVLLDPHAVSIYDTEHSGSEDRWVTLGVSSAGRLLVVGHTFRETGARHSVVRVISSRKATTKEAQTYGH